MLTLGVTGGPDLVYEDNDSGRAIGRVHDTAAALALDGDIVAAIEEERLNRIKHSSKGPVSAIKFCLDAYNVTLRDIDRLVIAGNEEGLDRALRLRDYQLQDSDPLPNARGLTNWLIERSLRDHVEDDKLNFVHHHIAHAVSAYMQSGFDRCLVVTMDGAGDDVAGMILNAEGHSFDVLQRIPIQMSLGLFYLKMTRFLGFDVHDEYKVMGLAPYGDPERYRDLFKNCYELLPEGNFVVNMNLPDRLMGVARPRKKKEPIAEAHKDIAAALQEALEIIFFHVVQHHWRKTRQSKLCLAGGVALNCSLTGKLLYSGMFEDIFVHPASHDGGLAVGAALHPFLLEDRPGKTKRKQINQVYWGSDIGDSEQILETLTQWKEFIDFEYVNTIAQNAANLLAGGAVIGWVQGRSEFGPRALGNRSIVADPRPAENRDVINQMVKKRESFRPFAPSVQEEYVAEYFEVPPGVRRFPFMTFVVKVRPDKRDLLGATTHVDGTARLHTVSKKTNPRFWELIDNFREITGVPVLLNTSFNNNYEPIVDSAHDAIVSFLTTKLDYLVIGDYLIRKRQTDCTSYKYLTISLPLYSKLVQSKQYVSDTETVTYFEIKNTYNSRFSVRISAKVFNLLLEADGATTMEYLIAPHKYSEFDIKVICEELATLWALRVITLKPKQQAMS